MVVQFIGGVMKAFRNPQFGADILAHVRVLLFLVLPYIENPTGNGPRIRPFSHHPAGVVLNLAQGRSA